MTPVIVYFQYLIVKFTKMGQRLFDLVNDRPATWRTELLFFTIMCIFLIHYFLDIFLYLYPFLYLYGLREECPSDYQNYGMEIILAY